MGQIVSVFMLGLLPFTLFYVILRGFYAVEDTRTPFLITVGFSLAWLALAIPLFRLVGPGGPQVAAIALAYGISYWLGCAAAWILLRRRLSGLDTRRTLLALLKMGGCAVVAVAMMAAAQSGLGRLGWLGSGVAGLAALVVVVSVIGVAAYLIAARVLRVEEVREAVGMARRRLRLSR